MTELNTTNVDLSRRDLETAAIEAIGNYLNTWDDGTERFDFDEMTRRAQVLRNLTFAIQTAARRDQVDGYGANSVSYVVSDALSAATDCETW